MFTLLALTLLALSATLGLLTLQGAWHCVSARGSALAPVACAFGAAAPWVLGVCWQAGAWGLGFAALGCLLGGRS